MSCVLRPDAPSTKVLGYFPPSLRDEKKIKTMWWQKLKRLLTKKWLMHTAKIAAIAAVVLAGAGLAAAWLVPLPARLNAPGSRVIEYADGMPMCIMISPDEAWRVPVRKEDVDPDYVRALVAYEDHRFYRHPGVDPLAAARALAQDLRHVRVVSGASTITMQLVRILEPRPRTVVSKLIESMRAIQLELRLSKDQILAGYLTFAPFGGNLEGVEAASLAFFGHRGSELSPDEIAYLLTVPQRPAARTPAPEHEAEIIAARDRVIGRLVEEGVFGPVEEAAARAGRAPTRVRPFPREVMHVSQLLAERHPELRLRSTIRRAAQTVVDNTLTRYRKEYADLGIYNATVVVVEVDTGRVVAAEGNFDFWDTEHQGQVYGFLAPRSPGSAMKPFIYALALDRGLILPEYLVPDAPVSYNGYEPINFDRDYRGLVRISDALSLSLNVPMVGLLDKLGMEDYLQFLTSGGLTTLSDDLTRYGLSAAVGGMEVRPAELANLYAMLARGGQYRDLVWLDDQPAGTTRELLSPAAAYLTREALRRRDRPDFPRKRLTAGAPQEIFWKTGTSSRHRDAWAVGGAYGYVAVVWLGNFTGLGSPWLTGADRAGPLLFDVLDGMGQMSRGGGKETRPEDLIEVQVCDWSGYLAGPYCPHTKTALAIQTSVPRETCPYHVSYTVDKPTGLRLNPLCAAGKDTEAREFLVLPATLRRWIKDNSLDAETPPPFHPDCRQLTFGSGPRISYPHPDAVFFIVPGLKPEQQEIKLEAQSDNDSGSLSWFIDGKYLNSGPAAERLFFIPTPGDHELRVQDEAGRGSSVRIKIMTSG
jgi:penicillin-binding protein 1C